MKRRLLTFILFLATIYFASGQDRFKFDQLGLKPGYLVINIDSTSKTDLFKRSINWIKENYKNPDEVIKTTIDNEKIRFEGFRDNLLCTNAMGIISCDYGVYTIELEFKDNKYKFTPISLESPDHSGGMISINFNDGSGYYNKKGEVRKVWETIPTSIEDLFNELNESLKKYTQDNGKDKKKDDW